MSNYPYTLSDSTLTVIVGNRPYTIHRRTAKFDTLRALLNDPATTDADILAVVNPIDTLRKVASYGNIAIVGNTLTYRGDTVHNVMAERILAIAQEGLPIDAWVKFADKVYANPYPWAVDELYLWLETNSMPITPDGNFIAYKKVRNDYRDIYSGRFSNRPGLTVELPGGRECVDKDRARTCSTGLHFCSASYLPHFGMGEGNRVVLVEIDPSDVVSIPRDYNNAKGRTWRYKVVGEVPADQAKEMIWPSVATFEPVYDDDYDDDGDIDPEVDGWNAYPVDAAPQEGPITGGVMRLVQRFIRTRH